MPCWRGRLPFTTTVTYWARKVRVSGIAAKSSLRRHMLWDDFPILYPRLSEEGQYAARTLPNSSMGTLQMETLVFYVPNILIAAYTGLSWYLWETVSLPLVRLGVGRPTWRSSSGRCTWLVRFWHRGFLLWSLFSARLVLVSTSKDTKNRILSCLNFWDEVWWFLSLRVFGQICIWIQYGNR